MKLVICFITNERTNNNLYLLLREILLLIITNGEMRRRRKREDRYINFLVKHKILPNLVISNWLW